MRYTNLGVQLFPMLLLIVGYLYMHDGVKIGGAFCMVLAIAMWLLIWSERLKKEE